MSRTQRGPPAFPFRASADPLGMRAQMIDFLEWMRTRNYSESGILGRAKQLKWFADWAEERSVLRPAEVTKPILERYQRHLFHYRKRDGKPLGVGSQLQRLAALRVFFRWLARHDHILSNPAADLELPRMEQRLPKAILSLAEVERVMSQPDVTTALGLRDRAILETLYSTGARRKEVTQLSVYGIDHEKGALTIRLGKGKKDRVIPIGERALAWVEKYLAEVRPQLVVPPDSHALFLTESGEALTPNHLSYVARKYIDAAKLEGKSGSCHLFRHTMATMMLEGGADLRFIQQMLGHADLQATQIYTRVAIHKLKEVHTLTHPGAKLGPSAAAKAVIAEEDAEAEEPASAEELREQLLSSLAAEAAEENEAEQPPEREQRAAKGEAGAPEKSRSPRRDRASRGRARPS